MQAIILCGGLSSRLGKTTQHLPKNLLKIGGRTVLEWQLRCLIRAGVTEVILASGHLHDVLYTHVGESYAGMKVRYAKEEKPLGTGGAIQNALRLVDGFPVFVLHGDILLKGISLAEMRASLRPEMDGLVLGVQVADLGSYGEIVADARGRITAFQEKQQEARPGCANGAVFLFNRTIVNAFPQTDTFSIERDVFPFVTNLYVYNVGDVAAAFPSRLWIDIGVPARLEYARQHFTTRGP